MDDNGSITQLAEQIMELAVLSERRKIYDFGKQVELLLREAMEEPTGAYLRGQHSAYRRAAEMVRTKYFEALGQDVPAEEWLATAIEALGRDK